MIDLKQCQNTLNVFIFGQTPYMSTLRKENALKTEVFQKVYRTAEGEAK